MAITGSTSVGRAPRSSSGTTSFAVTGRPILDGVSGRARGGRMLAITAAGSGKTSVLNALAGQVRASKRTAAARRAARQRRARRQTSGSRSPKRPARTYPKRRHLQPIEMTVLHEPSPPPSRGRRGVPGGWVVLSIEKRIASCRGVTAAGAIVGCFMTRGVALDGERKATPLARACSARNVIASTTAAASTRTRAAVALLSGRVPDAARRCGSADVLISRAVRSLQHV